MTEQLSAVIEVPGRMSPAAVAELRAQFDAHPRLLVLPEGARLRTIGPDGQMSVDYIEAESSSVPWWAFSIGISAATVFGFVMGLAL